ncbi:TPM domain-containing protein [Lederbergia citrea]|uniref:TPM domain-containing protein n=1 Tax=Lederbergia citrea TaxID=2833581 RepID=UPI001BC8FBF4|nr:TPM domain-containing protein [Lederbergia citrea]MBS4176726.1 TPM domain-containing protein [Lederbergia citrea]MBS4203287.1 TPM domain-containing protein [Lederbergia citrea]
MKKALLNFSLIAFIVSFMIGTQAHAASVPAPVGDIYVQDFANIMTAEQKKELVELGTFLDDQTKAQIAVLTVNDLENIPVEEYALQAFRQYKLGGAKKNNGVLLVLALQDRKIRIEVGYGLEGALPDSKVGRILDSYALPYLDEGKLDLAITNTYKQLFNEVSDEYKLDKRAEAQGYEYGSNEGPSLFSVIIFTLIILGIVFLDFRFFGGALTLMLLRILSAASRGGGRGGRGGGGGFGGPRGGGGGSAGGGGASRGW